MSLIIYDEAEHASLGPESLQPFRNPIPNMKPINIRVSGG